MIAFVDVDVRSRLEVKKQRVVCSRYLHEMTLPAARTHKN